MKKGSSYFIKLSLIITLLVVISLFISSCTFFDKVQLEIRNQFKKITPTYISEINLAYDEYVFTSPSQTISLEPTYLPEKVDDSEIIFISSNEKVATVDQFGVVTPVGYGFATITAVSAQSTARATCDISVNFHVYVEGIELEEQVVLITELGATKQLFANVYPENATNKKVIWNVLDENVVSVNENGVITTIDNGSSLVEAHTAEGDFISACYVMVDAVIPLEGMQLDTDHFEFKNINDELQLHPIYTPANTTEKEVVFSSSNERIVQVDSEGNVTALSNGTAYIKVTNPNTGISTTCDIKVQLPISVQGIKLGEKEYTIEGIGNTYKIKANVLPTTADNKKLHYKSNDESVATVNANGLVTSKGIGSTTITVTTDEGSFADSVSITVIPQIIKVSDINLAKSNRVFNSLGETYQINASVYPEDASDKRIKFVSEDPDIFTVDENGLVKAVGYGITNIRIESEDGNAISYFYAVINKQTNIDTNVFIPNIITDGETRGVWVSTVTNIDFPSQKGLSEKELKNEINKIVGNCAEYGINTIFLQVRPMADAIYESSIYPSSEYITSKQGDPLPFDVLEYFISAAHSQGIELHAWINPYRISIQKGAGQNLDNLAPNNPAVLHPDWVVKHTDGAMYFNPGIPEVRQLIIEGIAEIISKYSVDGIHFDDYFYPANSNKYFNDAKEYAEYGNGMTLEDWRRDNVNKLVQGVSNIIKSMNPSVKFGISPGGIWAMKSKNSLGVPGLDKTSQSYYDIFADSRAWVINEWVDYICPQIYWSTISTAAPFKNIATWWSDLCSEYNVEFYTGIAAYRGEENAFNLDEYSIELAFLKTLKKTNGAVFFSYTDFVDNNGDVRSAAARVWSGDYVYDNSGSTDVILNKPYSDELFLYTDSIILDNSTDTTFILGVSDPNYPLYLDDKEITDRTVNGYFAYFFTGIKEGVNEFVFTHKDKTVTLTVMRRSQPESSNQYLDSFSFVKNSFSPSKDYAASSGSIVKFSCKTAAGAEVYVIINDEKIDLKTDTAPESGKYLIATYTGEFVLPQETGNYILGSPTFYAEYNGKTITSALSNNIEIINDSASYVIQISKDKCDLIPDLNLNPDDYYFGTIGSFDAVVSKKNGYSLLKSGLYISDSDYVKHSSTNLQLATIGTVTLVDAGSYTNVVIPMNTKANHVVWQYDDRAEIIIYNVENKDSMTSSMNGVKTLFSDITIKEAGENAIKIILTYQKELHIFGYYCSFESDNLIVHFKNPVKISEGSKMLTGIKISLDPGHSDNNGALGFWGTQKFYESQLNLILSRKVAEKLTALGAEVQLTHNGEGTKGLDALISKLRVWAPDINISIHFNSISDDLDPNKISGCETYYSFSQSKLLAQSLLDLFTENTPIRKRSVKQGYYKVTRFTEFPSVLFETAFITNPTEYEWFMSDNNIDQAANAIVAGVVTYFQSIS